MPIWVAGISAVGSIAASQMAGDAAGDAADAQAGASEESAQLQYKQYLQNRQDMLRQQNRSNYLMQPYQDAGYNALNALQYGMGFGDPNAVPRTEYSFNQDEFIKAAMERQSAADPRKKMTTAQWNKLTPEKRAKLTKPFKAIVDQTKKGLASGAFNWYQGMQAEKIGGWVPQDKVWKTPQGVAGAEGGGEGGRFGFGDYGFLNKRFGLSDFEKEPGYEFRRNEGNRGIEASAAARGGLQSGAALKALNRFNQDYASNEYGNAYNRFTNDQGNIFNRLSGLAGTGQAQTNQSIASNMNTTQNIANMGTNVAGARGNALTDAANARASGFVGAANANNQMWSNLANTATNYWAMNNAQNQG